MACKMWKITALTWEISSWRLAEKFHISAFYVLFSILLDCGAWNYKIKKKCLLRIQKKGHKNKHKKTWMKCNGTKWTIWYFQQFAGVNGMYFAPVVTKTYCMKNNKGPTRCLSLEISGLARERAQLLNMLHINTHLSVPHGENI